MKSKACSNSLYYHQPSDLPMSEFAYINWLRRLTPSHPHVLLGPGDDAAALKLSPSAPCLVTTDMLMDGSCFRLAEAGPRRVGRKAMAVNLSDIAAMAGKPIAAVAAVGLPRQGGRALAEELYRGLRDMADAFDTALAGGDTNSWDGPLVISVTVIGEATGRGPVTRAGARAGDWLLVTGPLGGSIFGKHLDFMPRVREAMQMHTLADLHAMIDVSDGLAADVHHICEESRCGAVLRAEAIPLTPQASALADGRSPLEHGLSDGEDFELVFAVSPETAAGSSTPSRLWESPSHTSANASMPASGSNKVASGTRWSRAVTSMTSSNPARSDPIHRVLRPPHRPPTASLVFFLNRAKHIPTRLANQHLLTFRTNHLHVRLKDRQMGFSLLRLKGLPARFADQRLFAKAALHRRTVV